MENVRFMEISVDTAYIISTFIRKFMGSRMLMGEVIADVLCQKDNFLDLSSR